MIPTDVKKIIDRGDWLFSKRTSLLHLWQEIAEQFYVERADFVVGRSAGDDFAAHLNNSYPMMARRDLGNSLSSMLRPSGQDWFKVASADPIKDRDSEAWLEWATQVQKRAMYDRVTQFTRATKEGDHDFASFGQAVLQVTLNRARTALLYRTWHLRDVAWCENSEGAVDTVYRRWKPSAEQLVQLFGKDRVHGDVAKAVAERKALEVNCYHIEMPAAEYPGMLRRAMPTVSVYVDIDHQIVLEEVGLAEMSYVIPRWQTVSGSQYAYSPATVCALPDARLLQSMTLTILEAGEKAVNPPLIATKDVVRGDVALFAGGITWVDQEYDERLGEALRPMTIDKSGIPLGIEMTDRTRLALMEAFYLNKISLPMMAGDMTATEVSQRVQEYIRQAMPIFEPMEAEYNAALCERSFNLLLANGAFGPPDTIPQALRNRDVVFRFESPLSKAAERDKGQTLLEGKALLAAVADIDPGVTKLVNAREALRDALSGIGFSAAWTRSQAEVEEMDMLEAQRAEQERAMQTMAQGAAIAEQLGKASQAIAA